jgi:hypothetical protein
MLDIILDTLLDGVKLLPFLFISYLIIEFIEHKASNKINNALAGSGKFGSFIGALLGCFPQCGFSGAAASLYSGRIITLGTLIAVFISTSDEAIPILISNPNNLLIILQILIIKVFIAILFGGIIDFVVNKKQDKTKLEEDRNKHLKDMCSHCHCESEGVLKPALKHTLNIFIFILVISFVLNIIIKLIGENNLSYLLLHGSVFQPLIAGLIGLIPNCASSILLTELYLAGSISFASVIAGLSSGAGIGLIVLFKTNKNLKENIKILLLIYGIGVVSGIIIEIISKIF